MGEAGRHAQNPRVARFGALGAIPMALVVALGVNSPLGLEQRTPVPALESDTPEVQAGEVDDLGAFLYGRDCTSCHGADGRGSWRGPSLEDGGTAATYYMLATGRMPIAEPDAPVRRSEPHYSADEIRAVVDHVAELVDGPELPDLDPDEVDLALGGEVYRLHCGQCHSSTGIGGALLYGQQAPPVLPSEPTVIAAAVVSGPGAMPSFSPTGLTDEELVSVVAFVEVIQDPLDAGGLPLGRAGRVDEGLVGWGVGLAALVLLIAWVARPVDR